MPKRKYLKINKNKTITCFLRHGDMIQLLIAEDNAVVRNSLTMLFEAEEDITVSGQAENGEQALELLKWGVPCDILLTDISMPYMGGIELTNKVTADFPNISVLVLTMHDSRFNDKAREAGAKGFLLKQGAPQELINVIRLVSKGGNYFL